MANKFQQITSRAVVGMIMEEYNSAVLQDWVDDLSRLVFTETKVKEYASLGQVPGLREWIGGRQAKSLNEFSFKIESKKYEATLLLDVDDLDRDQTGELRPRIAEFAQGPSDFWVELLSFAIENGQSLPCYDEKYFFAGNHESGSSGVQSNLVPVDISATPVNVHGVPTKPSPAEFAFCVFQAIIRIMTLRGDQGRLINQSAMEFRVMVPMALFDVAAAAITADVFAGDEANTLKRSKFRIELSPNPLLTWTDQFVVFRKDSPIKPLIRQQEKDLKLTFEAEGSALEHNQDQHSYGLKTKRNVGFGRWQHAMLVQMT